MKDKVQPEEDVKYSWLYGQVRKRAWRMPWRQEAMRRTGGSETSQYPEEKKSTEISSVAASERDEAQKFEACQWNAVGTAGAEGETPVHGSGL